MLASPTMGRSPAIRAVAGVLIGLAMFVANADGQTAQQAAAQATVDSGVFNYILNQEYLMAEFYSCASSGQGIAAALRLGGPPSIGCHKANINGLVAQMAAEFAQEEANHIAWIQGNLGEAAIPMPQLNIDYQAGGAFSAFASAALGQTVTFNPYADNLRFLLGAYIMEDVIPTAWEDIIWKTQLQTNEVSALGLTAAEGYHAGAIRQQLIQQRLSSVPGLSGMTVQVFALAISDERAKLSNAFDTSDLLQNDDQGITNRDYSSVILVPSNGYTFERTPTQVKNIFTGGSGAGWFFPDGFTQGGTNVARLSPAVVYNAVTDANIFVFALNLEYMEADFYSWASTGRGLTGHCGSPCPQSVNARKANLSPVVQALAYEMFQHEYDHVAYFNNKIGNTVPIPSKPVFDFSGTFAALANAAMGTTLSPPFDPFKDDLSFLIAAYVYEDVGVTAYTNALPKITDKSYLRGGSGITALEAYHAGAIRALLLQNADTIIQPWGVSVATVTAAISALRAKASHAADDIGIIDSAGSVHVTNADQYSIAVARTPAQLVSIATLGSTTGKGGFYPAGFKGAITGSPGSAASAANLPGGANGGVPATAPTSGAVAFQVQQCHVFGTMAGETSAQTAAYNPGLTQFASLLSYLNWAGRVGASWCSPSVGPGFTTILAPSNGAVVRALQKLNSSYKTVTSTHMLANVYGTGSSTDLLHTAFDAIAEQHFIPAIVDFYNSPTILKATAAKPVRILVGMLNRTPGAYINAYTSKGTVYVAVRGRALVAGPFAVPKTKTVLRAGTAGEVLVYVLPGMFVPNAAQSMKTVNVKRATSAMTSLLKTIGACQTSYPTGYPTLRRRGACRTAALVGRRR